MSCCLPLAYWQERKRKQQQAQEEDAEVPLLDGQVRCTARLAPAAAQPG
jgi:hypothetical protein